MVAKFTATYNIGEMSVYMSLLEMSVYMSLLLSYNKTTPSNQSRNRNQLKIHCERIKKPVGEFQGCWIRINEVYQNGVSDDQLKDQAMQMYASSEHNEKPHCSMHGGYYDMKGSGPHI